MKSKLLSLLLCIFLIGAVLVSCNGDKGKTDREYDEAEVCVAARVLIEKSKILNEIYYGAGIPYKEPIKEDAEIDVYMLADPAYLSALYEDHGIKDIETLKEKTKEVFSKTGSASVISAFLQNTTGINGMAGYARYYMAKENVDLGTQAGLMVRTNAKNYYENTASVEYIYDGMHVSAVDGEYLTVSLKVKTTGKDGTENTRDMTVKLIEEENGYRLSGSTVATHQPQL
ncbi:MAG: hypothetical protein IKA53_05595 [Clostridia bacterium]|nr:hypothetical protein [Clostridia bacterium]